MFNFEIRPHSPQPRLSQMKDKARREGKGRRIFHQDDLKKGTNNYMLHIVLVQFILFFISSWYNSSYSSNRPGAKQIAWQRNESIMSPNSSNDLCLLFCLYPSSMRFMLDYFLTLFYTVLCCYMQCSFYIKRPNISSHHPSNRPIQLAKSSPEASFILSDFTISVFGSSCNWLFFSSLFFY